MDYYFYNTDAKSLRGGPRYRVLIDQSLAITGGPSKYGEKLRRLGPEDCLLMYENDVGIVAVGTVFERWDGVAHKTPLYYRPGVDDFDPPREYRIGVEWFLDLSDNPIEFNDVKRLTGSTPSTALKQIGSPTKIAARIEALCGAIEPAIIEAADVDGPGRVETTTYRILRDTYLARRVKRLHNFKCQVCGHTIRLSDGGYYAEGHHMKPLGGIHKGPDLMRNILCLCPNHHTELDYGARRIDLPVLRKAKGHPIDPQFVEYHNTKIFRPMAYRG